MTNVLQEQNVWYLDTEGVVTANPVYIRKIVLIPNAAADAATFTCWGPQSSEPTVRTTMIGKTVTTSLTTTITSTGNFEATTEALANDIIEITKTSTANNLGSWQIGTRSSDDAIIVDVGNSALSNDTGATYDWKVWKPAPVFKMVSPGTEKVAIQLDFGEKGFRFPNLAMHTLSTSAVLYVYVL